MASPTPTFATLRALHLLIADALDDIQRVFSQNGSPHPYSCPPSQCSSPVYACFPDSSPASSPFPTTPPTSFPPTPLSATFPSPPQTETRAPFVDYPSPDMPLVPDSPGEQLALHPDAVAAASKIVAACGQMSNIVHKPFLSLCDAIMNYNLPACMRLVEHLHVTEILREAEENRPRYLASGQGTAVSPLVPKEDFDLGAGTPVPTRLTGDVINTPTGSHANRNIEGLHITDITSVICSYAGNDYIDPSDLVHILRLLSTHHIFRETSPDTFALTRVASLLDSGKSVKAVFSNPEAKYDDTGGIPAFVALTTDELFKSAAYLTEAFTGVQLPTLVSTPNPSFATDAALPRAATIPSASSDVINDPAACALTTRSSSVLTHIVYPENEDARSPSHLLPPMSSPGNDKLHLTPTRLSTFSQSPEVGPSAPRLSSVEASAQVEKERLRSGEPTRPEKLLAFNLAFCTHAPLFEWLENGGEDPRGGTGQAAGIRTSTKLGSMVRGNVQQAVPGSEPNHVQRKSFRLERFSKAMMATTGWEAPKAILSGFDWYCLPRGSTIVDVGGGIGSTTMILARALNDGRAESFKKPDSTHNEGPQCTSGVAPRHSSKFPSDPSPMASHEPRNNTATKDDVSLRFVVQDRPVVTALGIDAWRSECPEMLENGQVVFQDQDFFEPQPYFRPPHLSRHPAVYLLRVVLHDWPDELARRILINLRVASNMETRLVIAEHVLPLACVDDDVLDNGDTEVCKGSGTEEWTLSSVLANVEGAERTLVPPPLLSNLGKASANAYWMDLIMHISLNGKERTLREFCALALSAGWRVTRMTRPEGSLFAYLVCEPITLPDDAQGIYNAVVLSSELSTVVSVPSGEPAHQPRVEPSRHKQLPPRPVSLLPPAILERSSSRCGTPTFGSRMTLPKDEELRGPRPRGPGAAKKWLKSKGLGVRNVVMQKAEKQREEQNMARDVSARDNVDGQNGVPASPSHMRVWWKKSPSNSTVNSTIAVPELRGDVAEPRSAGRVRRGTLKSSESPSTPSPRVSLGQQNWPSTESSAQSSSEVSPPALRNRRQSVASITRKLSFATFGRRPSVADISEPMPTPPSSARPMELAPPPTLQGDTGRRLKHLPSSPTLGRNKVASGSTVTAEHPALPRRPSLGFVGQLPPPQSVPKATHQRGAGVAESPKSGILKSRTRIQSSPDAGSSTGELTSPPRHQRRLTLSNSLGVSSLALAQVQNSDSVDVSPPGPAVAEVRRTPSVPKFPRRLSIPTLRRKQSRSVVQDGTNEGATGL